MYKWFALKRVLKGIFTYVIIIFIMSVLFNTVNEQTMRSNIESRCGPKRCASRTCTGGDSALSQQRRDDLIHLYRLDRPFMERYYNRTWNTLTFIFGKSTIIKSSRGEREVLTIVGEALPRSLILFTLAAVIEIIVGIILGLKKAQKPGGSLDRTTSLLTMIVYGMPTFWVAMILIMFFVYQLKISFRGMLRASASGNHVLYRFVVAYVLAAFDIGGHWFLGNLVCGEEYCPEHPSGRLFEAARARGIPENKVLFGHTCALPHLLSSPCRCCR